MEDFVIVEKGDDLDYYMNYTKKEKNTKLKLIKINKNISSKITVYSIDLVHSFLLNVENVVLKTSSQYDIEQYAKNKLNKDLSTLSLPELDYLAESYISYSNIYVILDGLLGIGGILFSAIELPLLLCIVCRLLTQLAWIYGLKCNKYNPVIVLRLLVGSIDCENIINDNKEITGKLKKIYNDDSLALCEYNLLHDSLSAGALNHLIKLASYSLGIYFSTSQLLNLIPIIGFVGGIGANYYYINTTAKYALKILRKDWILRKYGEIPENMK